MTWCGVGVQVVKPLEDHMQALVDKNPDAKDGTASTMTHHAMAHAIENTAPPVELMAAQLYGATGSDSTGHVGPGSGQLLQSWGEGNNDIVPAPCTEGVRALFRTRMAALVFSDTLHQQAQAEHLLGEMLMFTATAESVGALHGRGGPGGVREFTDLRGAPRLLPILVPKEDGHESEVEVAAKFPGLDSAAEREGMRLIGMTVQSAAGLVLWARCWWACSVPDGVDRDAVSFRNLKTLGVPQATPLQTLLLPPPGKQKLERFLHDLRDEGQAMTLEARRLVNIVSNCEGGHVAFLIKGNGGGQLAPNGAFRAAVGGSAVLAVLDVLGFCVPLKVCLHHNHTNLNR